MTFKDILVQVDETPASAARAAVAARLAAAWSASLRGVFLGSDFLNAFLLQETLAVAPVYDIDAVIKDQQAAVDQASEAARRAFEAATGAAGVASGWFVINGDSDRPLAEAARRADLTIMPPAAAACCGQHRVSAGALALASGRPVLVLPQDLPAAAAPGRRVLIAWNGSRESARALADAWPFLHRAETVHVLVVSPTSEFDPDGALQRHLERHGIVADLIFEPSAEENPSQLIRRHLATLGCDLMVMGVFGRSRLGELLFGGVSDHMLRDPPCALLIAH